MKKIVALSLILLLGVSIVFAISTNQETPLIMLDNEIVDFDVQPIILQNRVLIPFRKVFEKLGAEVEWIQDTKTVIAYKDENVIMLSINNRYAVLNGEIIELDVAPILKGGRTLVPIRFIAESLNCKVDWDDKKNTVFIQTDIQEEEKTFSGEKSILPTVGSIEKLKSLLSYASYANTGSELNFQTGGLMHTNDARESARESIALKSFAGSKDSVDTSISHSETNVQVQGVDEADIVKTDGQYIYQVNNRRILIIDTHDPYNMKIVSQLQFEKNEIHLREIFVDDKYLIVIGDKFLPFDYGKDEGAMKKFHYYPTSSTMLVIYDISDKNNPKEVRSIEMEGDYLSSRKIGQYLYLTANKGMRHHYIPSREQDFTPYYTDSNLGETLMAIGLEDIYYFPNSIHLNYLMVMGLDLDNMEKQAHITTYLGAGNDIYASLENMYVAVTYYEHQEQTEQVEIGETEEIGIMPIRRPFALRDRNTKVYKFQLNRGEVHFDSEGKVPGVILNQFSMDEYNGYFRIATTTGNIWRTDEHTSKNNVYILDKEMNLVGKVEGIAPTERIYAMRFMGDKGYMVTFRETDPFFVLDLQDPKNPKVLGYLKIPGYSDYLHPYDENHIIGFGKEVYEHKGGFFDGGMKIAVFDVSDVNNPIEKFKIEIGDRGTYSELLHNHKALLFSKDKNIMAFPITVMEVMETKEEDEFMSWGQFTFQGAYIYHLDIENGFNLAGRITHLSDDDYKKAGHYWYDSNKNIVRILYVGDYLYTISNHMLQVHELDSLGFLNKLILYE